MLIRCAESSILVGCACNDLIGCALVFITVFWSVLLFLLSTLSGHKEVIMEVSRIFQGKFYQAIVWDMFIDGKQDRFMNRSFWETLS
jgi:hypothetical protein